MKKSIVIILALIALVASCENPVDPKPAKSINGSWTSSYGESFIVDNGSYEKTVYSFFSSTIVYAEKGSVVVDTDNIVVTKTHEKPDGSGDWVSVDFATDFEAKRASWSEYLIGLGMSAVNTEEYWNIQYTWAVDGTSMYTPYAGYTAGMTLDEYKIAAETTYTASLTRTITYTIDDVWSDQYTYGLSLDDDGDYSNYYK